MSRVLETVRIVTPLGLQLVSEALRRPVVGELSVIVSDPAGRGRQFRLAANGTSCFVAHQLPGISQADLRVDDWTRLERPLRIDVTDPRGEHLPFSAIVNLPRRGLLTLAALDRQSPPHGDPTGPIPIFAAPSFGPVAQGAAIRVELSLPDGAPAAWALVIARIGSATYRGVTDSRGSGLVALPWPQPPRRSLGGSPPELADYRWPVTFTVFCDRLDPRRPPDLAELLAQTYGPPLRLSYPASPPPPAVPTTLILSRPLIIPPATLVPV